MVDDLADALDRRFANAPSTSRQRNHPAIENDPYDFEYEHDPSEYDESLDPDEEATEPENEPEPDDDPDNEEETDGSDDSDDPDERDRPESTGSASQGPGSASHSQTAHRVPRRNGKQAAMARKENVETPILRRNVTRRSSKELPISNERKSPDPQPKSGRKRRAVEQQEENDDGDAYDEPQPKRSRKASKRHHA